MAYGNDHRRCTGFFNCFTAVMKKFYALFLSCSFLFLLNVALKFSQIQLPAFFRFYFNDLLALPIVLSISLLLTRLLHKDPNIRLGLFTVFSVASMYAVYFELYLPDRTARYTADVLDVVLYFSGAYIFYIAQPPKEPAGAIEQTAEKKKISEVKK